MRNTIYGTLLLCATLSAADNVAWSIDPPKGLKPSEIPMFVSIGFDDNGFPDAMNWIANFEKDLKNKDGSPVRSSFYNVSKFGEKDGVLDAWKKLYANGDEIGVHTINHDSLVTKDLAFVQKTILGCQDYLSEKIGIPKDSIFGFRSPYLTWGANNFTVLQNSKSLIYDCSVEIGWEGFALRAGYSAPADKEFPWGHWVPDVNYQGTTVTGSGNRYFPFTLDSNWPKDAGKAPQITPGVWEMPVWVIKIPPAEMLKNVPDEIPEKTATGLLAGLDFNLWRGNSSIAPLTKEQFLGALKFNFQLAYRGNRSPFVFGAHTDIYSKSADVSLFTGAQNEMDRRWAIEEFIKYVIQFDDVRVVPAIDIIRWMQNPKKSSEYKAPTIYSRGSTPIADQIQSKPLAPLTAILSAKSLKVNIPLAGNSSIRLLAPTGKVIANLYDGELQAGEKTLSIEGKTLASGVYFVQVNGACSSTIKVVLK